MKSKLLLCLTLLTTWHLNAQNHHIEIQRKSITDQCIMGYLNLDGEVLCYTLELPYIGNINNISTIPAGHYTGFVRVDGNKGWRIELENVQGRKNIQIHIGNYTSQIQGCTLIGMGADVNGCTVSDSKKARNMVQEKLGPLIDISIEVNYLDY